jgi:Protein of unknown function (DUF4236)
MGWRYRKSKEVGPMRVTFSKSGVSKSIGNRFFRITDTATGGKKLTFTLPGTGLSWVKEFGRDGGRRRRRRQYEDV